VDPVAKAEAAIVEVATVDPVAKAEALAASKHPRAASNDSR
jgi:hypothetical protein